MFPLLTNQERYFTMSTWSSVHLSVASRSPPFYTAGDAVPMLAPQDVLYFSCAPYGVPPQTGERHVIAWIPGMYGENIDFVTHPVLKMMSCASELVRVVRLAVADLPRVGSWESCQLDIDQD
ncbi:hypothetical protein MKZ38_000323 [Zalerion maritima]|uniref:Uncharacterized protein n=1 Tax=Zalerion maritima TaxID=339359 RepID=A0AAD5RG68_9PEZI|nr:hypothetical protein MKZ38_000323 [Zalerion maritima]